MLWDVRQLHFGVALEAHSRRRLVPHSADVLSVFNGVAAHEGRLALCLDDPDEPLLGVVEHDVLADEHAHADAREVEAVQKLPEVVVHASMYQTPFLVNSSFVQLLQASRYARLHIAMLILDVLQHLCKPLLQLARIRSRESSNAEEATLVQLADARDRGSVVQPERQALQLLCATSQAHGQLFVQELSSQQQCALAVVC
mmetsp:Transcript_58242/g.137073  ORF Transcript_58242/g.137073 Transcript_58242/m.137073 type:complete len:200 (-) Transcript_58242:132-731(-)